MARDSIKHLIDHAIRSQGLRSRADMKDKDKVTRRYEWKMSHGFRKFFQTNSEPKMKSLDVMTLMGQNTGLAASYNKPTVNMLLDEYLKAVDNLTIDKTRHVKDKEMQTLRNEIFETQQNRESEIKRNR